MFRSLIRLTALACIPIASFVACGDSVVLGRTEPPISGTFVTPDASAESSTRELTTYCASNECPTGFTTCPTSRFLCDVDLRSDRNHCGACGEACPADTGTETYMCTEGHCVMQCRDVATYQDCDGLIDTGCETAVTTNENCGACGNQCSGTTCNRETTNTPRCGCAAPYSYCDAASPGAHVCFDLTASDENCGACGITCNRAGSPGVPPAPPNSHYGCGLGQCDSLRCDDNYADCNQDLGQPGSDGCELALGTHENCTRCGENCAADGMLCAIDFHQGFALACRCPPGTNFCGVDFGPFGFGVCANFTSDPANCGACGRGCPGTSERGRGVCEYGTCKLACGARWADCNGDVADDCEVDVFSDPQNCGGCGIACADGQACAGGRCVVEPCKEEQVSR